MRAVGLVIACVLLTGCGQQGKPAANAMPLKTFLATRPAGTQTFTLAAQIDDYYNYEFSDCQPTHYSVALEDLSPRAGVFGYVAKEAEAGRQLFDALRDGGAHTATVDLSWVGPRGEQLSPRGNVLSITRVHAVE